MPFDAAKYLDTEEAVAAFLTDAFESGHDGVFQDALKTAARARGMSKVAKAAGVGRESLYKALQAEAQPRFATVRKVLAALGVQLAVVPAARTGAKKRPVQKRKQTGPATGLLPKKVASKLAKTGAARSSR